MIKNFLFSFYVLLALSISAQSPRTIIVEHFTNSRCSICAANNPAFYQTMAAYPQVLHIAFHPSAPYSNCIFSQQNPVENDARTNFYGAYGSTPKVAVQGKLLTASNPIITNTTLDTVLGQTSPVEVNALEEFVTSDSIRVTVKVKTTGVGSPSSALLFAGVAEEPVLYNAPNGENVHHDVFRKALSSITGSAFSLPAIGDSTSFEFGYKVESGWNINQLYTMAFVQLSSTKEILNAAKSTRVASPLSITPLNAEAAKVYPNPAVNRLFVLMPDNSEARITNVIGDIVWQGSLQQGDNALDISDFKTGFYFLQLPGKTIRFLKAEN